MSLLIADLPETREGLAAWLEEMLLGPNLSQLVGELTAIHGTAAPRRTVAEMLGTEFQAVLEHGLGVLDRPRLRDLLIHPTALLELQNFIFTHGGDFWRDRPSDPKRKEHLMAQWRDIQAQLPVLLVPATAESERPRGGDRIGRIVRMAAALLFGLLAGFAGCYLWLVGPHRPNFLRVPTTPTTWGWNTADAVRRAESPQAYRERLAVLLEEWSKVVPAENSENRRSLLAVRLLELRGGCTRMALASHPLPEAEAQALASWSSKFGTDLDLILRSLEQGRDPIRVAELIDELVREHTAALRTGSVR